jgi:hypothetical protein
LATAQSEYQSIESKLNDESEKSKIHFGELAAQLKTAVKTGSFYLPWI